MWHVCVHHGRGKSRYYYTETRFLGERAKIFFLRRLEETPTFSNLMIIWGMWPKEEMMFCFYGNEFVQACPIAPFLFMAQNISLKKKRKKVTRFS